MSTRLYIPVRLLLAAAFLGTSLPVPDVRAAEIMVPPMPTPGTMVNLSPAFSPPYLNGLVVHADNALTFDFLVHKGDGTLASTAKGEEYKKLVKYFLAALTVPDKDQWVNLSPYENNRIIENEFGKTDMGRDLLAQDYLLKQITSSLMYPESGLGKNFWDKVYERAYQELGHTNIPVNTFNKVWIVPDEAVVYESGGSMSSPQAIAYVVKSHLKVMLEEDYVALKNNVVLSDKSVILSATKDPLKNNQKNGSSIKDPSAKGPQDDAHAIASRTIREIILPILDKEVNEGKNFAQLRQVFASMLLATWYKKALRESLLGKVYADKAKVQGVDQDPKNNDAIYQKYLEAFKKGVYNYIKEDEDKYTSQIIPRKYFAGGAYNNFADKAQIIPVTGSAIAAAVAPADEAITVGLDPALPGAAAARQGDGQTGVSSRLNPDGPFTQMLRSRVGQMTTQKAATATGLATALIPLYLDKGSLPIKREVVISIARQLNAHQLNVSEKELVLAWAAQKAGYDLEPAGRKELLARAVEEPQFKSVYLLGPYIQAEREASQVPKGIFATRADITVPVLFKIESSAYGQPGIKILDKIAGVLGVDTWELSLLLAMEIYLGVREGPVAQRDPKEVLKDIRQMLDEERALNGGREAVPEDALLRADADSAMMSRRGFLSVMVAAAISAATAGAYLFWPEGEKVEYRVGQTGKYRFIQNDLLGQPVIDTMIDVRISTVAAEPDDPDNYRVTIQTIKRAGAAGHFEKSQRLKKGEKFPHLTLVDASHDKAQVATGVDGAVMSKHEGADAENAHLKSPTAFLAFLEEIIPLKRLDARSRSWPITNDYARMPSEHVRLDAEAMSALQQGDWQGWNDVDSEGNLSEAQFNDVAAKVRGLSDRAREILVMAVLHDMGYADIKPDESHQDAGVRVAQTLVFNKLGLEDLLVKEAVLKIIEAHSDPYNLATGTQDRLKPVVLTAEHMKAWLDGLVSRGILTSGERPQFVKELQVILYAVALADIQASGDRHLNVQVKAGDIAGKIGQVFAGEEVLADSAMVGRVGVVVALSILGSTFLGGASTGVGADWLGQAEVPMSRVAEAIGSGQIAMGSSMGDLFNRGGSPATGVLPTPEPKVYAYLNTEGRLVEIRVGVKGRLTIGSPGQEVPHSNAEVVEIQERPGGTYVVIAYESRSTRAMDTSTHAEKVVRKATKEGVEGFMPYASFSSAAQHAANLKDRATVSTPSPYGGIDLNSANFDMVIKRDGKGVPLPLAQQDMAQLGRISGFVPNILEIRPAVTLPLISQYRQDSSDSSLLARTS